MNPDIYKLLEDVLYSIELIEQHTSGINSLKDYSDDLKTVDAVERRLSIIGEAVFKANKLDGAIEITDKQKIIGLRHILVHEYNLIDDATIWIIVKQSLLTLKEEINKIIVNE